LQEDPPNGSQEQRKECRQENQLFNSCRLILKPAFGGATGKELL
jgi:hypothetical protein